MSEGEQNAVFILANITALSMWVAFGWVSVEAALFAYGCIMTAFALGAFKR